MGLHGEHEAGAHRLLVELHGAGAANSVLAADLRPGEPLGADEVGEEHARLDLASVDAAVDRDGNRPHALARSVATMSARRVSSATRALGWPVNPPAASSATSSTPAPLT